MAARRPYALTVVLLAAGAALTLLAAAQPWATGVVPGGLRDETVDVTGSDLAPGVRALGLLALAGVLAVLATRQAGRRLVGAALAVCAALGAATAVWRAVTIEDRVQDWARGQGSAPLEQLQGTPWPWVAAAAALLVLAAGVATAVRGPSWPTLGRRFDRTGERAAPAPAVPPAPGPDAARRSWDALDRGEDPTA